MNDVTTPSIIEVFDEVTSTNTVARDLFESGAVTPRWVVARRQTAGRGRRGRSWSHQSGNFAGTLLWPATDCWMRCPGAAPLIAGLSIYDALTSLGIAPDQVSLKWPNDVWLDRRKTAGVLVEVAIHPTSGKRALAVGIGVNLANAPPADAYPTACVADFVPAVPDIETWCRGLDAKWRVWAQQFETSGFGAIRASFERRAAGFNGPATILQENGEVLNGTFTGIDDDGAFLLSTEEGAPRRFLAGDVSLRLPAT